MIICQILLQNSSNLLSLSFLNHHRLQERKTSINIIKGTNLYNRKKLLINYQHCYNPLTVLFWQVDGRQYLKDVPTEFLLYLYCNSTIDGMLNRNWNNRKNWVWSAQVLPSIIPYFWIIITMKSWKKNSPRFPFRWKWLHKTFASYW